MPDLHPNHPHPDQIERLARMERVWEMRRVHATFATIASELGIGESTARKLFNEYRLYLIPPAVEEERILRVHQLEELMERLWEDYNAAFEPKDRAVAAKMLLAAMKEHSLLLGLHAAVKFAVEKAGKTSEVDAWIQTLIDAATEVRGDQL